MKKATLLLAIAVCCVVLPASVMAQGSKSRATAKAKATAAPIVDKLTENILSELIDAASRKDLERYTGTSTRPFAIAGGKTTPAWDATVMFPGAGETVCLYQGDSLFTIIALYKDESPAKATARAAALNAAMKKIVLKKGGVLADTGPGTPLGYLLGKGVMYLTQQPGDKPGADFIMLFVQHTEK